MFARLIRVKALLLLLVFLAAGTSLPSLDSLLFHGDAGKSQGRIHLEPAGGCLDHGGHCVLGRTATGAGAVASPSSEIRIHSGGDHAGSRTPDSLLSAEPLGGPHSRAPPVLLV